MNATLRCRFGVDDAAFERLVHRNAEAFPGLPLGTPS